MSVETNSRKSSAGTASSGRLASRKEKPKSSMKILIGGSRATKPRLKRSQMPREDYMVVSERAQEEYIEDPGIEWTTTGWMASC